MLDYFAASGGFIGGGIRAMGVLGEKPFVVKLDLNEWLRFEKPGKYTLSVRSQRVSDEVKTTPPAPSDRARGIEHRRIRNPASRSRMGGGRARRRAADSRFEDDPTWIAGRVAGCSGSWVLTSP